MSYLMNCKLLFLACFVLLTFSIDAQEDLAKYQQEHPTRDYIFLERNITLNFLIENDNVVIEKTTKERKLFLNGKAKTYEEESVQYDSHHMLKEISAKTLVPKGGRYKTSTVKDFEVKKTISDNYFYDDLLISTFTYPNLVEGAISELEYVQTSDHPIFVPRIFMTYYAPIVKFQINVIVDKRIDIAFKEFNTTEKISFEKESKRDKDIYTYILNNVQPPTFENRGPSFEQIAPHLIININKFQTEKGENKPVMGSLQDLYNNYYSFINSIDTTVNETFRTAVDSITTSKDKELDKVESIYNWVRKNIKYIAFEDNMGGFIPRDPQLVFDRRFGDCKDMSSITLKMLDVAGIQGHYAWVGTRDIPYKYSEDFGAFVDNHMIAMYYNKDEKKYYHLDATNEFLPFGYPPPHIQDKEVLVHIDEMNYDIVPTSTVDCSQNKYFESGEFTIDGNNLNGQIELSVTGHEYLHYQNIFGHTNKEQLEKRKQSYFSRGTNKSKVGEISFDVEDDRVTTHFDIEIGDYIAKVGDELLVNMNLEKMLTDRKIKKSRTTPIDLKQTYLSNKTYTLKIPEGYEVKYLPENFIFDDNDDFTAEMKYTVADDVIHYHFNVCINTLWLETDQFDDWSKLIKKLKSNYKENIILGPIKE